MSFLHADRTVRGTRRHVCVCDGSALCVRLCAQQCVLVDLAIPHHSAERAVHLRRRVLREVGEVDGPLLQDVEVAVVALLGPLDQRGVVPSVGLAAAERELGMLDKIP